MDFIVGLANDDIFSTSFSAFNIFVILVGHASLIKIGLYTSEAIFTVA